MTYTRTESFRALSFNGEIGPKRTSGDYRRSRDQYCEWFWRLSDSGQCGHVSGRGGLGCVVEASYCRIEYLPTNYYTVVSVHCSKVILLQTTYHVPHKVPTYLHDLCIHSITTVDGQKCTKIKIFSIPTIKILTQHTYKKEMMFLLQFNDPVIIMREIHLKLDMNTKNTPQLNVFL